MTGDLLVIGYGNPLLGDDGLGWHAAQRLATAGMPGVRTILAHQLLPEHAAELAGARLVVLVDADASLPPGRIAWRQVVPEAAALETFAHHVRPEVLAGLAASISGSCPPVWVCAVGASGFAPGDALSPEVAGAIPAVLERIGRLAQGGADA